MEKEVKGILDEARYGDTAKIPLNQLLTYVDQLHEARRAGTHHDIRFGDRELFSWAGRYGLPAAGERAALFQQPLHSPEYADFEGEIPEGRGAGRVTTQDRGNATVTEADSDKIKFTLTHREPPESYTMIRMRGENKPWLVVNSAATQTEKAAADFAPDYTPAQLKEMGAYHEVYGPKGTPRLASLSKWPEHWYHKEDPHGWLQWYARYSGGRRMEDDTRQIKRWRAFKARHGGRAFQENPTPRRAYALRNWGIDPVKLLKDEKKQVKLIEVMNEYRSKKYEKVGECVDYLAYLTKLAGTPAWQRSEGKNPEGGLNAAGRTSYNRETGGNLKAPVTEKKPTGERAKRQNSFCARMCGHKRKNTGAATKNDPDSRVNKALRKWRCKCGEEAPQKKVKKEKEHPISRAILASTLGGAAQLPVGLAGAQLAMRMPSTGGEALSKEKLQNILQNSELPKHLQPKIHFRGSGSFTGANPLLEKLFTNAMYDSVHNAVSTTGEGQLQPGILAHELGHAQIHHKGSSLAKMLQDKGRAFSGGLGPLSSLVATQFVVDADDTNLQGAGKGAIAGLSAGAPMLLNEADASRRGIAMLLRSNLGAKQKLMGSLSMLPAFATYTGAAAGVPAIFGSLTARAKRRVKEKNKALETNSTKAEAEKTAGDWLKYQAKLAAADMEWSRAGGGLPEMAGAFDALKNQIPKMQQAAYNFGGKAYDFLAGVKKPQTGATPIKPVVAGGQIR